MDIAHFVDLLIHLDCFHLLAAVYNATVNIYTHFCVTVFICLGYFSRVEVELLGHLVTLCLNVWETARLFSKVIAPLDDPDSNV